LGAQTITATDTVTTGATNTSSSITVGAPSLIATTLGDDAGSAFNCTGATGIEHRQRRAALRLMERFAPSRQEGEWRIGRDRLLAWVRELATWTIPHLGEEAA
jgi:hypothetical protein